MRQVFETELKTCSLCSLNTKAQALMLGELAVQAQKSDL